jgi:hypothetical protein
MGIRDSLKKASRKTLEVDLGDRGKALVQEMSGTDRDAFVAGSFSVVDGKRTPIEERFKARLVVQTLVENGKLVYTPEDVDEVSGLPCSVLDALFSAAQKVNGLDADAIENAAKNSGSAATGAPSST